VPLSLENVLAKMPADRQQKIHQRAEEIKKEIEMEPQLIESPFDSTLYKYDSNIFVLDFTVPFSFEDAHQFSYYDGKDNHCIGIEIMYDVLDPKEWYQVLVEVPDMETYSIEFFRVDKRSVFTLITHGDWFDYLYTVNEVMNNE